MSRDSGWGKARWRNLVANLIRERGGEPVTARDVAERYGEEVPFMSTQLGRMRRRGVLFVQKKCPNPEIPWLHVNAYGLVQGPTKQAS